MGDVLDGPREMVVVFRSRLRPDVDGTRYAQHAAAVLEAARAMPGFLELKDFVAQDGERLALVRWRSAEELAAWRDHAGHRLAQAAGRERYYSWYHLQVAPLERGSSFALTDAHETQDPEPRAGHGEPTA